MGQTDLETTVHEYPIPRRGVDLHHSYVDLNPEEAHLLQNLIFKNGLVGRTSFSRYSTTEVVASKKILGLHRFNYGASGQKTLVACGTLIKYGTGGAWTVIDATVGQSQTTGLQTNFNDWGALGKCYITNGTDVPIKYDGTTALSMSGATNMPNNVKQFLVYQDRMLCISNNSNIGALNWSNSFSDTAFETVDACGIKPDTYLYGMVHHSATNVASGYDTKVLIAGKTGMYIFAATNLSTAFKNFYGDFQIYKVPIISGCQAWRTMCWTPKGTLWLGDDKMVYLLPFNDISPIPVGKKIRSTGTIDGLNDIPSTEISSACAVYHDGFYKIAFAGAGQSTNNTQYWLAIDDLYQDDNKFYGPWFGPMIGTFDSTNSIYNYSFSCFAQYDGGEILAGEDNVKGMVYQSAEIGTDWNAFTAAATTIPYEWDTFLNPLGNIEFSKCIHQLEIELGSRLNTINIDFHEITGAIQTGHFIDLAGDFTWGSFYWGAYNWSGITPTRVVVPISPNLLIRRLKVVLKCSSSTVPFVIYALRLEVKENRLLFESVISTSTAQGSIEAGSGG